MNKRIITKVLFHRFQDIIVTGNISEKDRAEIETIQKTMSFDEYAGYSPDEQKKYKLIKEILENYECPIQIIVYKNRQ